jgi:hypothetical protein
MRGKGDMDFHVVQGFRTDLLRGISSDFKHPEQLVGYMHMRIGKLISFLALMSIFAVSVAQEFPTFLEGTWRVINGNSYEHWDRVDHHTLKGFMFKMESGLPKVTEYLEIKQEGEKIIYSATVLDQNNGESIPFTLNHSDSVYSFENPEHDFPTIIRYTPLPDQKISVFVGTMDDGFELELVSTEEE